MSKKSRKRNKKILAALALAGGAAMLAKGRGRGVAQGVSGADKAGFTSDAAYSLPKTDYITKKVVPDVAEKVVPNTSSFKPRVYPGTMLNERPGPRHALPPSMKGGALHAEGWTPRNLTAGSGHPIRRRGGGIAKRGTGVALKSGGRVKSMGIAKRGGGIAKR